MHELVSILIPAYNAEKWLKDAIESSLKQTWPNKEIIIVDDGSTDNTYAIANNYQTKNVLVVTQNNRGASSARNKALAFAQGDYIQWLDADDTLAPDKIARQIKENVGGHSSPVLLSSAFGMFYYRQEKATFKKTSLWQDLEPIDYFLRKLAENVWMQPAAWLVSRKLTELAGPWNERLSLDDDGEYFCRVVAASERIRFVAASKSYYRVGNMGSLSMSKSNKALESLILSTMLCIGCLRALEDSERTRAASLKYLRSRFWYLDPEKYPILAEAESLAENLGGGLFLPPHEGGLFCSVMSILGLKMTMNLRNVVYKSGTTALRNWDRFMYNLCHD